ncbi:MAG: 30S ribosomal protein S8 [Candidatus Levybacteria bacterium]|nr:30S ribosomal protein S8 [Candidatus Levybacteria bacterium]
MNHKVSDLIIRIKNASRARRREIVVDNLRINKAICKVLVDLGFLEEAKTDTKDGKKVLVARIKYYKREPVLNDVKVVSKPSLRIYAGASNVSGIQRRGKVTAVLSTSRGIMTGQDAVKRKIGGEVLFKIW